MGPSARARRPSSRGRAARRLRRGRRALDGEDVKRLPDQRLSRLRNQKIGFIFQSFNLIPDLDVFDNVDVPLRYRGPARQGARQAHRGHPRQAGSRRAHAPPAGQLSAASSSASPSRAPVAGKPQLLLADEPTGNLDSQSARQIMDLLARINAEEGMTIVMVTHDHEFAAARHRKLHILDGKLIDPAGA